MFQKDTDGYYYYNSNSNYYYYDTSTKTSHLYSRTYSQDTEGTGGHNAKPMGFFPFHPYNSTDSNHLYVNQNTVLNHHFGMSMEVTFALPADKKLENSKDIIYDFSGDDDLWVFIDDDLALDIGGIHQPVRGYINFTTGKVYVYGTNNNNEKEVSFIKNMEPGKEYTLRMFYLERGGCDSNLSVKFNIPLTIGKGDFKVIKKGENNINLQGAKFGLWENKECQGNPLRTSTSGSNGIVSFENLPVKEPGQEYYMEEMAAPTGYIKSAKKYIVKASDAPGTDGKFVFSIYEMNEDGTIGNELTKMEEQPRLPIIVNKKQVKKSLSLEKSWQDEFGLALVPSNVSATFVLHKVGYVANFITSQNQPYTVILQNPKGESLATGIFYENDKIRLLYEFDSNSVSTKMTRKQGDSFIDYAMLSSGSNKYVNYTVDASHADAQNQIIFRRENDANGKSHGFKSGLRWALQPGETSHDTDTTQISGTVDQTTTFTLPENGDWTKTFTNQDTYDDNLEPFKYWFEEISCTAEGYIPMTSNGADAPIGEGNSQAIKNVKPASIKIIKVVMGTETPISGAGFTLTQVDDSGREIPDGIKKEQQLTDDDGVLVFDELVPGRYKLEESKVPDGYIKNEGAYFIIVNDDYTTKLIDGNEYTLITKSDTGASVYYVQNEPGAALPSTGGLGTSMFYLLGITLIGLAVAGLVLKKAVIT